LYKAVSSNETAFLLHSIVLKEPCDFINEVLFYKPGTEQRMETVLIDITCKTTGLVGKMKQINCETCG